MSENYYDPNNRASLNATGVTATETVRGAVRGGVKGLFAGPVFGFLAGALALAVPTVLVLGSLGAAVAGVAAISESIGFFSTLGAMTPWVLGAGGVAGLVGGSAGMLGGAVAGGPVGALVGSMRGVGRANDIVNHERGAAQMLATQQAVASSQEATAAALMAQAQRPVIIQAPSAPVVAPGFTVTAPSHQGQGMAATRMAANDVAQTQGAHTQRVDAARAEQQAGVQQVGA